MRAISAAALAAALSRPVRSRTVPPRPVPRRTVHPRWHLLSLVLPVSLCACAGVDVTALTPAQAQHMHAGGKVPAGYVVYAPMVVVEVTQEEVCVAKDDKGHCQAQETRCLAGKPFTLPDESRPYLVSLRSGLGKAGSQIDITDGWMLGRMRDDADGTSSLGLVQKLLGLRLGQAVETGAGGGHACMAAGLYRATLEGAPEAAHVALHPLLLY